ncbi:MAG: hypothetical protein RL033_5209 [Pseudomonadota bacterium]
MVPRHAGAVWGMYWQGWALAWGVVSCAAACAASAPPLPVSYRSPPGSSSAIVWPAALAEADASSAVVVLAAPQPQRAARRMVRSFFSAVQHESGTELSALLGDGATISSGPGSSPEPVPKVWSARFKRLDYGVEAQAPYREDQLAVFTPEELARLGSVRRYALEPTEGELLAVVTPRERSSAAGPRYFGRRIEFILGTTEEGLRILRMFEDFRLP